MKIKYICMVLHVIQSFYWEQKDNKNNDRNHKIKYPIEKEKDYKKLNKYYNTKKIPKKCSIKNCKKASN